MHQPLKNPRSILHALAPIGSGTPETESLQSYFCRLAVSHSVSISGLSREIASIFHWEFRQRREWYSGNLNGMGEVATNWSSALSALTGVAHLDQHTLLPWQGVIAQTGFSKHHSHWCSQCFQEDMDSGKAPYFRLAWDINEVNACPNHKTKFQHVCPGCGRPNARHGSAYVTPGWCAHCGAFLGNSKESMAASPEELWRAIQVGQMLACQGNHQPHVELGKAMEAVTEIIERMNSGKYAHFAKRIGLNKSAIHNWLKGSGTPTLNAYLRIAGTAGIQLPRLLRGNLTDWEPPTKTEVYQLPLSFPRQTKSKCHNNLDWNAIRAELVSLSKLPTPISLQEAARHLDLDTRLLYLNANLEARAIGARWKEYMQLRGVQTRANAKEVIKSACLEVLAEGKAINLREIESKVPREILNSVEGVIDLLQQIKTEILVE